MHMPTNSAFNIFRKVVRVLIIDDTRGKFVLNTIKNIVMKFICNRTIKRANAQKTNMQTLCIPIQITLILPFNNLKYF